WAENTAKLTPIPSQVAPSGQGRPASRRAGRDTFSALMRQNQGREGREYEFDRVCAPVGPNRRRINAARIAHVAPAIEFGIGVHPFAPEALALPADAIAVAP